MEDLDEQSNHNAVLILLVMGLSGPLVALPLGLLIGWLIR